jgi:putative FmdB family regulatory protein
MPVYEYRCTSCEKEFEYQQRMADPPMSVCEACGGALERLISRTAFQLKGSGWYKDLYASSKPADASKPAESGEAKSSEAKTESKSDSTTTTAVTPKADKPSGGGTSGGGTSGTGSGSGSGSGSGGGSGGGGSSARPAA